jgi:asparagine synthase (glutamine-hydrolysing)
MMPYDPPYLSEHLTACGLSPLKDLLAFETTEENYKGKRLKRLAERYVPPDVLYRRKRGFVMPASDWLRGELAPYVRAALDSDRFFDRGWIVPAFVRRMLDEHQQGTTDWGEQLWTLFVLEVWASQTLDGTLARSDSLDALLR